MNSKDTIVSIATPMGTGAMSVIRCSGKDISKIVEVFFKKKLLPRKAYYIDFKKNDSTIDDVVVIYYLAPKSYTGEDMLEIMCHGGPIMYQMIINEILKIKNCRLAKAGEFSERAFLNNKMSILEAESICALINAKTEEAVLAARESMSGKTTQDLIKIDEAILKTRIQVEALLDFSEEDIETEGLATIQACIKDCKKEIEKLIKKLEKNRLLFETSKVAVIGKPNVGKSSLINFLTEEDVSIVNEKAGTTRDVVSKMFNLEGIVVDIYDTAGIRETRDLVEKEGAEKALKQAATSNIVLYLYDVNKGIKSKDLEILENLMQINKNILVVGNKIDLISKENLSQIMKEKTKDLFVSIKEKIYVEELKNKVVECLKLSISNASPGVYHIEHIKHLNAAYEEIDGIKVNLNELEIIAEKLKRTQENISMVLDNKNDDRVLSGIFSNFCIGK